MKRTIGFFLVLLTLLLSPVSLIADGGSCGGGVAEAKSKKPAAKESRRSESASGRSTKSKSSGSASSSRSSRSSSSRSASSLRSPSSSHHADRNKRSGRHGRVEHAAKSSKHGKRSHHQHESHKPAPAPTPPPPSPEQIEANMRRESSYQTMARAYRLYDEGLNARLSGDHATAVSKLTESTRVFNDARGYQRTGDSSINEALAHYELGQAAEGISDLLLARDSYVRCLLIRPTFIEASVKLVGVLGRAGQWQLALAKARDAVQNNPNDPRAHKLMSLALAKTGHPEEARHEANKAQECLKFVPNYKPMGIDAAWKRTHHEDDTVKSGSPSDSPEAGVDSKVETGKSDVDNPEDVMGVEEETEEE